MRAPCYIPTFHKFNKQKGNALRQFDKARKQQPAKFYVKKQKAISKNDNLHISIHILVCSYVWLLACVCVTFSVGAFLSLSGVAARLSSGLSVRPCIRL